jgi:predicted N-acetyltransferase YhbS
MEGITKRWIDGPFASSEDWDRLDQVLVAKGQMALNRSTSRVLVAEDDKGKMVAFCAFQLIPFAGPLHVNREWRGTGLAEELNDEMVEFMVNAHVRGWIVIADSKFVADYCEKIDMTKVQSPVYVKVGMEKA